MLKNRKKYKLKKLNVAKLWHLSLKSDEIKVFEKRWQKI